MMKSHFHYDWKAMKNRIFLKTMQDSQGGDSLVFCIRKLTSTVFYLQISCEQKSLESS